MGRQGNGLAQELANSHWVKTLVKEGRCDLEDEASHKRNWIAYISRDGNVWQVHVAKAFTHFGTIHKMGWFEEGGKTWLDILIG